MENLEWISLCPALWLMPIIPAVWEVEIGRNEV
jgi:hypothetical protein